MHVPPFNIPNLRIEQRKTSSAEDMARKNSAGEYTSPSLKALSHFCGVCDFIQRLSLVQYVL
jgi:hypothetical protein